MGIVLINNTNIKWKFVPFAIVTSGVLWKIFTDALMTQARFPAKDAITKSTTHPYLEGYIDPALPFSWSNRAALINEGSAIRSLQRVWLSMCLHYILRNERAYTKQVKMMLEIEQSLLLTWYPLCGLCRRRYSKNWVFMTSEVWVNVVYLCAYYIRQRWSGGAPWMRTSQSTSQTRGDF